MRRKALTLWTLLTALAVVPPAQGACPPAGLIVGVEPGRAVVFIDKAQLLNEQNGQIAGVAPPHFGTLEDLGNRFAYRPGDSFWTAGLDSFTLLHPSAFRGRVQAERVLLVPASSSGPSMTEGFDGDSLSWTWGGAASGLEIFNGAGVLSGSRSLRLLGGQGEASWLSASVLSPVTQDLTGGGQQGSTAQSTIRPPGGGGGGSSGFEAAAPAELAVLEGIGPSSSSGFRVWLRDDGEALSLRLESAQASTPWLSLSRADHRLQVTQWTASADSARRAGVGLWVDGALLSRLETPAATALPHRAETLRVGVLAETGPAAAALTVEMDDLRFAGLSLHPESLCLVADGFESDQLDAAWTASGNVALAADAALDGGLNGVAAVLGGALSPGGGTLASILPGYDARLGLRFRFDPNSLALSPSGQILLAEGATSRGQRTFVLLLEPVLGGYQLRLLSDDDRGALRVSAPVAIADAPQDVTLDWRRGISQFSNTGTLRLWIGGELRAEITGLRNVAQDIHHLRVGAVAVQGEALGRVLFDQVEAVRGPLP